MDKYHMIQQDPELKKSPFRNQYKTVSYTMRPFMCQWCQSVINFISITQHIRE